MFYGSREDKIVEILGLVGVGAIVGLAGMGASRLAFGGSGKKPKIDPVLAKILQDKGIDPTQVSPGVLEALRSMREGNP
jgi:hypothetical protein